MDKVDRMVLTSLNNRVMIEGRVSKMLLALKEGSMRSRQGQHTFLKELSAELVKNRHATERLLEAVENGLLPMDESLTERAHKLQARRQEILTEMAGITREAEMPKNMLSGKKRPCLLQRAPEAAARSQVELRQAVSAAAGEGNPDHGEGDPDAGELRCTRAHRGVKKTGHPGGGAQFRTSMAPE